MHRQVIFKRFFFGFVFLFILAFLLQAQTSPEAFIGFKMGTDKKLADYKQIRAYFEKLDQESAKLKVVNIGTSTLNKPMIMAIISSEENILNLEKYREIVRRLRDPRTLSPEEAKRLSKEGKIFLIITCSVHATEIGGSQSSLEIAHNLRYPE